MIYRRRILIDLAIVLIHIIIATIVQILSLLLGMVVRLLGVDVVKPLCFGQLVNLSTRKARKHCFRDAVAHILSLRTLSLLGRVHDLRAGGTADEFVGDFGLVRLVVDFVAGSGLFYC